MAKPVKMSKTAKTDDRMDKKLGVKEQTKRDTRIDKAVGVVILAPSKRPIKVKK